MADKEVDIEQVSVEDIAQKDHVAESETDKKITELESQVADLNDKYLRMAAELENTRRRAALDAESRARARAMSVAEKILPVMDAVKEARRHSPDDEGIKSLEMAIESVFQGVGITKIETIGVPLNPSLHNAIQVVDAPDDIAPNTIVEEMQSGYMFGDSILRTAMVVVAK